MSATNALQSTAASSFPGRMAEWSIEAAFLAYSGGTAPDFHRTSPLCPSWAPKAENRYITVRLGA
jgi:hypothetical protein